MQRYILVSNIEMSLKTQLLYGFMLFHLNETRVSTSTSVYDFSLPGNTVKV